jgi:hypothetical protein
MCNFPPHEYCTQERHESKSITLRLGHATSRGGGSEIELRLHKSCSAWSPINQSAGQLIARERVASVDVCVARGACRRLHVHTRVCLRLLHAGRRERNSKKRTFSGVRLTGPIVKSFQTNSPKKLLPHLIPSLSSSLLLRALTRSPSFLSVAFL